MSESAQVSDAQRAQYEEDRRRRDEWDRQPWPKSREREREENERAYWRAVAEIPNPGPVEPLTELQAFHAEQTDPPPGPYPDPPLGPYPDPVIKERPSEEAVYGKAAGERTRERKSPERKGDREYDEPNLEGFDPDISTRGEARSEKRGHTGRSEADRTGDQARER